MRRRTKSTPIVMMETETKAPSKKILVTELRTIYKTLNHPFDQEEYDDACSSACKSETIIEVFGSWDQGLRESGLLRKFSNHHAIIQEMEDFDPVKEVKKNWKQQKEKLLTSAEQKEIRWLKSQKHKVDLLKEMLDEAMAKVEPLEVVFTKPKAKPTSKAKTKKPRGTLWFEFSDLQLGTLITKEEMGGINQHDWGIWQDKLKIWKNEVISKIEFYKNAYDLDQVVIACLGDMVEGQNIFKGQQWQLDRHVVDQAIQGGDDTSAAFAEIFLSHPDIHFDILEVFGNHGRIGSKGDNPYACSMDKVYQRYLEAKLEGASIKNFTYHKNEAWFYYIEIYGWNHLLLHGDQGVSKIWSGSPTVNGMEKGISRYNQMFQNQVHFMHLGHFHTPVNWSFNISQILINGSFIGTSTFSATAMVASTPPVQLMYLFTPREGLDLTQRIYLNEDVKKPVVPRTLSNGGTV